MRSTLRTKWLIVVSVVVFLLISETSALPRPRAVRPFKTQYSTLSQACSGVLEETCPPASANRAECLMLNFVNNDSHECKLWVGWRTICMLYVEMKVVPTGLCNFTKEEATPALIRACLGAVDRRKLPAACYDNPYYKSLRLHSPRQMDADADL